MVVAAYWPRARPFGSKRGRLHRRRHGPDKGMAVLAARKNVFAIRRPGHRAHWPRMSVIAVDVFSRNDIYHLHGSIGTTSNGISATGGIGYAVDACRTRGAPERDVCFVSSQRFVEAEPCLLDSTKQQFGAIGRPGQGMERAESRNAQVDLLVPVPDLHEAVITHRGQMCPIRGPAKCTHRCLVWLIAPDAGSCFRVPDTHHSQVGPRSHQATRPPHRFP